MGEQQVYFPGSSLKGLCSHLEKVSRTLKQGVVCDPFHVDKQADKFCGKKLEGLENLAHAHRHPELCPLPVFFWLLLHYWPDQYE